MRQPDRKLIEGVKRGSYDDFRILYEKYQHSLYWFAFGLTRSQETAEDIVQETFIKVWVQRGKIDPDLSFKSYLFTLSRNQIIDAYRKTVNDSLFREYLEQVERDQPQTPLQEIEKTIDYDAFRRRLSAAKTVLSPREKQVFEMAKEEGLAPGDISSALGLSEQTVYNQLSTAMRKLRKELGSSWLAFIFFFY